MHKYRVTTADKRTMDNIVFDSKAEMTRYAELKLLLKANLISDLELQPVYLLQGKFRKSGRTIRAIHYKADFRYIENGKTVIEDVKGMKTQVYNIKKKMFDNRYRDLEIKEVQR